MGKSAGHELVQRPLSCMSKGGMTQIVPQCNGLSQILIEGQGPGNGAGDAADLQRMGHAGAVVVALWLEKHLGLVLEPPKGLGVDDPVHVPLKRGANLTLRLWAGAPFGLGRLTGQGRKLRRLSALRLFTKVHKAPPSHHDAHENISVHTFIRNKIRLSFFLRKIFLKIFKLYFQQPGNTSKISACKLFTAVL